MTQFFSLDDYISSPLPIQAELTYLFNRFNKLVIFDIGACEGEDSIRYSNLFPNSTIYSFEPVPENFNKAQTNIKEYKKENICLIPVALDEKNGDNIIYISEGRPETAPENIKWDFGNKSSSLLPPEKVTQVYEWLKFKKELKIKTKTIKDFCIENEITYIDLIHLDVQGAELRVLSGAEKILEKVKVVWLEVEKIKFYKNQPVKEDVELFMKKNNFIKAKDNVIGLSGDQLYVNKSYFKQQDINNLTKNKINNVIFKIRNKIKESTKYLKSSYSQSGEDIIIRFIFDAMKIRNPRWVDIGANHPFKFNNTALLYENGHTGINIEADNSSFKKLERHRPKDINLNLGISNSKGKQSFYIMSSDTLNTFSYEEAVKYESMGYKIIKTEEIETITISEVISNYCDNIFPELLSIDVEGIENLILKGIDFANNYPIVICIETISFSEKGLGEKNITLIKYLEENGYLHYADTYINSIFVKRDLWERN